MLFHTWTFALFFLVVWPVHLALRRSRLRVYWLLAASWFFYGWIHPLYPALIAYAALVDYLVVTAMDRSRRRAAWLAVSVVNNVGLLGVFKYAEFLTANLNALLAGCGISYAARSPGWLLPVGLSFFTFQSMSYTIDFYRGNVAREPNYFRYAAFVSLFPRLLAGPIERAKNLLPQLREAATISMNDVADGLSLFVVGLFKKVALADYLALYVDRVYQAPERFHAPALALATFAFAWQIYFDFSGYTDMARGLARLMGMRLMLNFNNPYLATGLGDFWRRWHISLSSWFRDYVYIPLGGNRAGAFSTYRNVLLTMVISGLWHGAAWRFVTWGALHGLGAIVTRALERSAFYRDRVPKLVKQTWVFGFVTFAWIFFRAESWSDAWTVVSRIFTSGWADPRFPLLAAAFIAAAWAYQFAYESKHRRLVEAVPVRIALVGLMLVYLCIFPGGAEQPFIYLQF